MIREPDPIRAAELGDRFAAILRAWFSPAELAEVRKRNRHYGANVCASHDFCDANEAMLQAFTELGEASCLDYTDGTDEHESACRLWGAAWEHAKAAHLTAPAKEA